jgi:hypothetical protein
MSQPFDTFTDAEILTLVEPLMSNMMEGSTEINHAKHTRDFTARMRCIVTPEHLKWVCDDYQSKWGFFGRREFVALFRRTDSVAIIWRQFCSRSSDERVAEAVFTMEDGCIMIDHAMVY